MKRSMAWLLTLAAIVLYCLLIYSWWEQGNEHQRQLQADQQQEELRLRRTLQEGLVH